MPPTHYPRVAAPISPSPSPPIDHSKNLYSLSPVVPAGSTPGQKRTSISIVEGVDRVTLGHRFRSLFLDPLQVFRETGHSSKNAASSWSPILLRKLRWRLGHYTVWQLIVIFAFAFSTLTLFRALSGVGYVSNDDLQYLSGSSKKVALSSGNGYPQNEAHATLFSIFGGFRRLKGLVGGNVAREEADDILDDLKLASESVSTNTNQRARHRLRVDAWKKSKPRRMGFDLSNESADSEDIDTPGRTGFAYAISHNDPPRRDFARHGRELTEHPVDIYLYQSEVDSESSG